MKRSNLIPYKECSELVYRENNHITGVSYVSLTKGRPIRRTHLTQHFVLFVLKGQIEVSCRHYEGRNVSEGHMIFLSRAGYMHVSATEEDSALLFFGFDEITIRTNESLMDFLTSHGNLKAHSNNALPVKKDMMDIVDRFAAKEIQFKVMAVSGMGKKEINSFFTGFNGHKFSAFAKISGGSKTIFAAKVAVMGNMKAHGFDRCAFHHISKAFVIIFAEKLAGLLKFKKFSINFDKCLFGIFF